jgi:hypothetical protein
MVAGSASEVDLDSSRPSPAGSFDNACAMKAALASLVLALLPAAFASGYDSTYVRCAHLA